VLTVWLGYDCASDFGDRFEEEIKILTLTAMVSDSDTQRERITNPGARRNC
jgi:hypothetical protein